MKEFDEILKGLVGILIYYRESERYIFDVSCVSCDI